MILILIGLLLIFVIGLYLWKYMIFRGITYTLVGVLTYFLALGCEAVVNRGLAVSPIIFLWVYLKAKYWVTAVFMIYGIAYLYKGIKKWLQKKPTNTP